MINSQGHTIQHYIDLIFYWLRGLATPDDLNKISNFCFAMNYCTSDCLDHLNTFINILHPEWKLA